ncbi:MAG: RNA-binding S4 domain-containing protein [Candidatus Eisenbacteria sp.]|nr:RNA-binding S4 domain-containing protein [Candidatus Eisenbacteria bacterium]
MRIDLFLKKTGLIKHRAEAKRACDHGAVAIDGQPAKPGRSVEVGQRVRIAYPRRFLEVEVLMVPEGNVRKTEREKCYRVVEETVRSWEE